MGQIVKIDDILIDSKVFETKFICDVAKCKGACCTFPGGRGAPLKESELNDLEKSVEVAKKYLNKRSLKYIETHGVAEGELDDLAVNCIDEKECVFVFFDGDVAKCSIEKAWAEGESEFRKPISCHLFPLREGKFGKDKFLYYDKFSECDVALERGERENIDMIDCVSEAVEREYGKDLLNKMNIIRKEIQK